MRRCARSVKIQTHPRKPVLNHADFTASTGQHELDHTHHTDHTDQDYVRCLRCTKFCSLGKRINIVMKPTNSPTQGQPNPRIIRLKQAFGPLFFHSKYFFFRGLRLILYRKQTTRNTTNPGKLCWVTADFTASIR